MDDDRARDRRLLCAANLTYDICHPRPGPAAPHHDPAHLAFYRETSGLADYRTFTSGWEYADAALLGVNDDEIVLAFRGTQPIDLHDEADFVEALADWIHDFDADLVVDQAGGLAGWRPVAGRVHRGFLTSLKGHGRWPGLWAQIAPALDDLIAHHPAKPVCITGHSKGGALAHLAALQCVGRVDPQAIYVCTFAAPRVGDAAFAEAYEARIAHSYRYEYHFDVVPLLPPAHGFYETIASHAAAALLVVPHRGGAQMVETRPPESRLAARLCAMPVRGYAHVGKVRTVADGETDAHAHPPLMNCLTKMIKGEGRLIVEYHSSQIGLHYANAVGLAVPPAGKS